MTDGRTDGRTDGGDCNIPIAFLKKRGDKYKGFLASKKSFQIFCCNSFSKFLLLYMILGPP